MLPYWLLFGFTSFFALGADSANPSQRGSKMMMLLGAVVILLFVGLRWDVGGDWGSYLAWVEQTRFMAFGDAATYQDPGYTLLNWIATRLDLGIIFVNLVCAAIFATGLVTLARTLPQPWLAITVAVPYLIIVVAMGYTRQAGAIGFAMLALASLRHMSLFRLLALTMLAVSFHKTAIVLLPLVALARVKDRLTTFVAGGFAAVVLYFVFVSSQIDALVSGYIDAAYQSQGAFIRVGMNSVAAVAFLIWGKRFGLSKDDHNLWRNFTVATLACIPGLVLLSSSTVIDRLALYLLPLQMVVFSHLPGTFERNGRRNSEIVLILIAYSAFIQFVWLNYAAHADEWLPYQMYPFAQPAVGADGDSF